MSSFIQYQLTQERLESAVAAAHRAINEINEILRAPRLQKDETPMPGATLRFANDPVCDVCGQFITCGQLYYSHMVTRTVHTHEQCHRP